jgi:hypothetical protein
VVLQDTNVSEDLAASIFKAARSSKTSVSYYSTTQHHNPEHNLREVNYGNAQNVNKHFLQERDL